VSPRAAAAAVARGAAATVHAPARPRTVPRPAPPRRRSGATARPRTAPRSRGVALPQGGLVGLLDRVLRGPLYIAVVGVLLAGIVFFNVDVLELNHGIASTDARSAQLKRENAALTLQLAQLGSSERIQNVALARGLVLPQPGDVRYLRAQPGDAAHALRVMTSPDPSSAVAATPTAQTLVSQQSTPVAGTTTTPATTTATPTTTTPATSAAPVASAPTTATTMSTPATTATATP
jgi:cell division protein FtsL